MLAAVGQICSGPVLADNLAKCLDLVAKAAAMNAKMLFLPEASDFLTETPAEAVALTTSIEASPFVGGLRRACGDKRIWVSVGIHEKSPEPGKLFNTQIIIDEHGTIAATYRKIHLFDVDLPGMRLLESAGTKSGDVAPLPTLTPLGSLGMCICFDLRFPEQAAYLRSRGADILTYPSAFTLRTGLSHWEVLLRARAIENQVYVVAAAQYGRHSPKRESFGHAMIVDPWGNVLATCSDHDGAIALADIDDAYVKRVRMAMPIADGKRPDLFR